MPIDNPLSPGSSSGILPVDGYVAYSTMTEAKCAGRHYHSALAASSTASVF